VLGFWETDSEKFARWSLRSLYRLSGKVARGIEQWTGQRCYRERGAAGAERSRGWWFALRGRIGAVRIRPSAIRVWRQACSWVSTFKMWVRR